MEAYCKECQQETTAEIVDNGIGRTEAWGVVSNHVMLDTETACCDSIPYTDSDCTTEITVDMIKEYDEAMYSEY